MYASCFLLYSQTRTSPSCGWSLMGIAHHHCFPVRLSDGGCSFQLGRTSTRLPAHLPHFAQVIRRAEPLRANSPVAGVSLAHPATTWGLHASLQATVKALLKGTRARCWTWLCSVHLSLCNAKAEPTCNKKM